MAATANSNPPPPPSSSSSSAAATLSPRVNRVGSSPWARIVRGPESESIGTPNSSADTTERSCSPVAEIAAENAENGGNAGGKKPVWNKKPSNGPVENGGPGPVVMGPSEAWPALSESTKASPKLSSSDSSKILPDFGSVSSPQAIGTELSSLSITPSIQSPSQMASTSHKPTTINVNHNPMPNHGRQARQKSMKRDGGGNPQANGGFSHQPSSAVEDSHSPNNSSPKPSSGGGSESSGRDSNQNHGHRESGQRNAGGDHSQPRNSYRRGGGGSHSRGEGSHQNYGGRRGDQERGNHDWNHQRSFNGRDASMQSRGSGRGFVRAPPVSAPYVHPTPMQAMRPYMNPLEVPPMFIYPGVPYPVPAPVFIPPVDPQLYANIKNQIEYYFSNENLIKDTYLRQNMDEHGWVPVTLIASFKKVMQLTENIQQILGAVRSSDVVELLGDKIRKRDDWKKWIMPPTVQIPIASGLQSPKSPTPATPLARRQNVVDEKTVDQNHPKAHLDVDASNILRSASGDLNSPLHTVKDGESSSGR